MREEGASLEILSPYQTKIGQLVALGYSNRDIASELHTSEQAVKSALHAIFDKLGVWNRVELATRFVEGSRNGEAKAADEKIELDRVAAAKAINLNDKSADEALADLVFVAATMCSMPIAALVIMESDRAWIRSDYGFGIREVRREVTFCKHVILGSDLFEVQDASRDDRVYCNPYVVGDPKIRFYAAVPLLTEDGYALGTLCVIDRVPRALTIHQKQALKRLAKLALALLLPKPKATNSQNENARTEARSPLALGPQPQRPERRVPDTR